MKQQSMAKLQMRQRFLARRTTDDWSLSTDGCGKTRFHLDKDLEVKKTSQCDPEDIEKV
jgi:hypothetical protein